MSVEQNKSILRRWIENGWNQGNLSLVDELYTADFVQYDPAKIEGREGIKHYVAAYRMALPDLHLYDPAKIEGREGIKHYVAAYRMALPDLHFNTDDLIAEGDKVVWRFTSTGTHQGNLMGIPPTGKQATVTGIAIFRLVDSQIAEVWVNIDLLGMLQQMGVIPAPSA